MCAFLTHLVTPIITIQQLHSSIFSRQVTICWLSLWSRSLVDLPSKCKQVFCIVNASVPVCNFPFERMGHSKAWTQLLLKVKIWIFNVVPLLDWKLNWLWFEIWDSVFVTEWLDIEGVTCRPPACFTGGNVQWKTLEDSSPHSLCLQHTHIPGQLREHPVYTCKTDCGIYSCK